ncbi:DEAD/DEAH box helicase [Pseudomonas allii]|uniref:DEAD/DEAH box helicase n=1 Tax=Pseudomonas allii TaxID=2740531 RepID=UPI001F0426BA|nr:DEAD/DEAH box helicase [Pseudomonas allii]
MDNVFNFRDKLINEYSSFSRSFSRIQATDIREEVERQYASGRYWPEPLIQINPNYQRKGTVQQLAADGLLHKACAELFQVGKTEGHPEHLHLYAHQLQALAKGQGRQSYVVTTGTGSGKSLSFFIPVIDRILKAKDQDQSPRTRAVVIYPMNALANSQLEELDKFLHGYPEGQQPFTVARYTGQESRIERAAIADNPPDILLTNFMMLELILTRFDEDDRRVVEHCHGLEFLILDELHTYRGRQGADVALLVRRLRERLHADELVCIGTSALCPALGAKPTVTKLWPRLLASFLVPALLSRTSSVKR